MHHEILVFLVSLAVLLGGARMLASLSRSVGFPAVVGELLAGIVLGKTLLGRVAPGAFDWLFPLGPADTLLTGYKTVAVMLLLVVAGLEIDLTVIRKSGRVVVLTSVLGIILPFAFGYGLGLVLPDSYLADPSRRDLHAAFLGIALSISALPVIAKTLLDLGLLKTDIGIIILSSAVFDDLLGWTGFSILSRQFDARVAGGAGHIGVSVLLMLAFVAVVLLVVRPIIDRILARMATQEDAKSGRVLSVIMVLALLGAAATQALGMHAVFGAFVMGIAIGDSPRLREHTRTVLQDFVSYVFTPVFFATMALRFDFIAEFDALLVVVVLVIACVAKIAGCAVGARVSGVGWRESFAIGFGKNSRGAMEILLAVLAMEAGIINRRIFVALVIMAVVTSMISGPALVRLLIPATSPIAALLRAGAVLIDPDVAGRQALIRLLVAKAVARHGGGADVERIAAAVLERESLSGTGVGDGVAFPHAQVEGIDRPALAFARVEQGIDFDAPDGAPVHLVFLVLTPAGAYDTSLQLLSAMARLLSQDRVRRALLGASDERTVIASLDAADRGPNGAPLSTPIPRSAR